MSTLYYCIHYAIISIEYTINTNELIIPKTAQTPNNMKKKSNPQGESNKNTDRDIENKNAVLIRNFNPFMHK